MRAVLIQERFLTLSSVTLLIGLALAFPAESQQAAVVFHNFDLPVGSWTNTLTGTFNGKTGMPPQTETVCSGPLSVAAAAKLNRALRFPAANCTTTVITDTPTLAVYRRDCPIEWSVTSTLTKLSDRHFTTDTKMTQGSVLSTTHIDGQYNGPCTPTAIEPPALPDKPTPEMCAQTAEFYDKLSQSRSVCDSMEEQAAQCRVRIDSELKRLQIQNSLCRG